MARIRATMDLPKARPRAQLDPRLTFKWEGTFEKWSRTWVRRNFWRVKHLLQTEEDALQECGVIFARCLKYYAHTVDNPAWMMALYKQSVARSWHKFATKDSEQRVAMAHAVVETLREEEFILTPDAPLQAALSTASEELQTALLMILDAPSELLELVFSDNIRANVNSRLRRLCGIKTKVDLLAELDGITL